jgi:hypothetical protein
MSLIIGGASLLGIVMIALVARMQMQSAKRRREAERRISYQRQVNFQRFLFLPHQQGAAAADITHQPTSPVSEIFESLPRSPATLINGTTTAMEPRTSFWNLNSMPYAQATFGADGPQQQQQHQTTATMARNRNSLYDYY